MTMSGSEGSKMEMTKNYDEKPKNLIIIIQISFFIRFVIPFRNNNQTQHIININKIRTKKLGGKGEGNVGDLDGFVSKCRSVVVLM